MEGISEIVGRAERDDGRRTDVYRALRSLLCATCGAEIAEGTLFTRRRVKGIGVRIMPQCQRCAPFALRAGKQEKSDLLQALLTGQTAASPKRRGGSSGQISSDEAASGEADEGKKVNEEVRRRLGPALKRSRRGRK
jgi:hypothetical protein